MKDSERIELLDEARQSLQDAISNIKAAVRGTPQMSRAHAYIIPHLEAWVDGSEMVTIDGLIKWFEESGMDEEEKEEDE